MPKKPPKKPFRPKRYQIIAAGVLLLVGTVAGSVVSWRHAEAESERMEDGYTIVPSPNFNDRPWFTGVDCVVLHATGSDTAGEAINTFLSRKSGVSAHFVVDRSGKVTQMVPIGKRAWHAGVSRLGDRTHVNDFSVGIEMVNRDDGDQGYTDSQYKAVAGIIERLRTVRHCEVDDDRIVSHASVALPPGRKDDPLGFDFKRLQRLLTKEQVAKR